jgi:hypothetical protein
MTTWGNFRLFFLKIHFLYFFNISQNIHGLHFKFTRFFCLTLPSPKERAIGGKFEMHPIHVILINTSESFYK